MLNELKDWIQAVLPEYTYFRGQWVDTEANTTKFVASIHRGGGPMPDVDVRRPRFRLILLGPRIHPITGTDGRQFAEQVEQHMEALMQAALGDSLPCGAASVRISEPLGPGYTTENRAWVSADLQIIF